MELHLKKIPVLKKKQMQQYCLKNVMHTMHLTLFEDLLLFL